MDCKFGRFIIDHINRSYLLFSLNGIQYYCIKYPFTKLNGVE